MNKFSHNFALTRREFLGGMGLVGGMAVCHTQAIAKITPRQRIIIDNDLSGDPDGLFQLAHHLASPSVEIAMIIGSHIRKHDIFDQSDHQAEHAAENALEIVKLMRLKSAPPILIGRNNALPLSSSEWSSPVSDRIIAEALRTDTHLPLFYAAGAGLTEIAAAHRLDPRIGKKIRLVWIGGMDHFIPQSSEPNPSNIEYNMSIDLPAARYIFNDSDIEIWQVPRDCYRRMLISYDELRFGLDKSGELGNYLMSQIDRIAELASHAGRDIGETYILGDSPPVTLTALQSSFKADSSSSDYTMIPTPLIDEFGRYIPRQDGRMMRIYKNIDRRLTFSDMFYKLNNI